MNQTIGHCDETTSYSRLTKIAICLFLGKAFHGRAFFFSFNPTWYPALICLLRVLTYVMK